MVIIILLLLIVSLGACSSNEYKDPCELEPGFREQIEAEVDSWLPYHEDALAARLIPGGYGGIYRDDLDANRLVIVLVDLRKSEDAVRDFTRAHSCGALYSGELKFNTIVVREGQYDAIQLMKWREIAEIAFTDDDAFSLGIDQFRNRIVVGVLTQEAIERVAELVVENGMPRDALIIEISEPPLAG